MGYVDRKKYDSTSRRGFYGVLDVLFSRRGMYLFLSAPVLMMFYLGASSLSPTKSQIHEQSLRSGWLDDTQVKYANVDTDGNSIDQGMELIPAYWHHKKKIWLRPNTYTNILKIGAGRQLTMVREYKTREGWKVPEGYVGPESERELQELAAKRADLLGIPRKLTDSEKETIVLARLKERNTKRKEKIEKRLKIQKKENGDCNHLDHKKHRTTNQNRKYRYNLLYIYQNLKFIIYYTKILYYQAGCTQLGVYVLVYIHK